MVQTGSFPPRKDCLTALLEETIEQAHQSFTLDQVKHVDITRYTPNSMNIRATTDYSGIAANPQDVASFAARECVQVTPLVYPRTFYTDLIGLICKMWQ